MSKGSAEIPNKYDQPRVGITKRARSTSKQAPTAQKISIKVTHVALDLLGKNSAYNVTLWGKES